MFVVFELATTGKFMDVVYPDNILTFREKEKERHYMSYDNYPGLAYSYRIRCNKNQNFHEDCCAYGAIVGNMALVLEGRYENYLASQIARFQESLKSLTSKALNLPEGLEITEYFHTPSIRRRQKWNRCVWAILEDGSNKQYLAYQGRRANFNQHHLGFYVETPAQIENCWAWTTDPDSFVSPITFDTPKDQVFALQRPKHWKSPKAAK